MSAPFDGDPTYLRERVRIRILAALAIVAPFVNVFGITFLPWPSFKAATSWLQLAAAAITVGLAGTALKRAWPYVGELPVSVIAAGLAVLLSLIAMVVDGFLVFAAGIPPGKC